MFRNSLIQQVAENYLNQKEKSGIMIFDDRSGSMTKKEVDQFLDGQKLQLEMIADEANALFTYGRDSQEYHLLRKNLEERMENYFSTNLLSMLGSLNKKD